MKNDHLNSTFFFNVSIMNCYHYMLDSKMKWAKLKFQQQEFVIAHFEWNFNQNLSRHWDIANKKINKMKLFSIIFDNIEIFVKSIEINSLVSCISLQCICMYIRNSFIHIAFRIYESDKRELIGMKFVCYIVFQLIFLFHCLQQNRIKLYLFKWVVKTSKKSTRALEIWKLLMKREKKRFFFFVIK